jgi:hypothetical protein
MLPTAVIATPLRRSWLLLLLAVACAGVAGCHGPWRTAQAPPAEPGWERESIVSSSSSCTANNCRYRFRSPGGGIDVRSRVRTYSPQQIPGWDVPRGERVLGAVGSFLFRQAGGTTSSTVVGLGTRTVTAGGELQLHCSVFWIEDSELAFDRRQAVDVRSMTTRPVQGFDCRAAPATEPTAIAWRVRMGIAPPRDSLALVFDSLAAQRSPALAPLPPITLERTGRHDGAIVAYQVEQQTPVTSWARPLFPLRLQFARPGGEPLAVLHGGEDVVLDVAPAATPDERGILRLIAGLFAVTMDAGRR